MGKEVSFHVFLEKLTPNYPPQKVSSHYEEEEAPVEFEYKVEEYYHHFFYQAIEIVANCIHNRFQ